MLRFVDASKRVVIIDNSMNCMDNFYRNQSNITKVSRDFNVIEYLWNLIIINYLLLELVIILPKLYDENKYMRVNNGCFEIIYDYFNRNGLFSSSRSRLTT